MTSAVLFVLALHILCAWAAGVPAPDDSEATLLPPSLVYRGSGRSTPPPSFNLQDAGEQHHSSCNLNSEDLVTTARAAVARVMKGMCCTTREPKSTIDDRLFNLESQFADQMNVIKTMLLNMEERIGDVDGNVRKLKNVRGRGETCNCAAEQQAAQVSSLTDDQDRQNKFARDSEIQLYNSSIYFVQSPSDVNNGSGEQRVFTYYWRVRDMSNKLKSWEARRSVRSPSFYVSSGSYKMYMRMFPRQNSGKNVYLHVGLTKGEHDATLEWPFRHKMRISVLDQRPDNVQDINSRVWDPSVLCSEFNWKRPTASQDNHECVGLGFPQEVLTTRDYVVRNTLVVKFTLFLDL